MERITFIAVIFIALSGAYHTVSAREAVDIKDVIEVSGSIKTGVGTAGLGIDPIITGTSGSIVPKAILPHLDACDANCQAKRLGIKFD